MNYTVKNKHIVTLLAAMAGLSTASVFAATGFGSNLQDDDQIGTTYVSAQDGDIIRFGQLDTSYGGGAAPSSTVITPDLASGPSNTDYVYTSLNSVTPDKTTTLQGGLEIDPNSGNTTVAQGGSQTASLSDKLIRVRRIEVYNQTEADPTLWGQAVDPIGETQYGYVDTNGNFQQVLLSPEAVIALDAFVLDPLSPPAAQDVFASLSPDDITALGSLYSPGTLRPDSETGRLTVEGTTTTNGITNTGNIATGTLGTTGAATVGGTLGVTGATTTNGVTNTGNISTGTLSTSGAATLNSVSVTNNATVGGTLGVTGLTSTNGIANTGNVSTNSLNVSGTSTLATANITTANVTSANVSGLTVTGAAAFTSRPTVGATVAIPTSQSVVAPTVGAQVAGYTAPVANATNQVALTADVLSEAQARASADSQLQANINSETAARIVDVNAEEDRARAAETALAGRATALEGRATALEGRATSLEGRMGRAEGRINSLRKGVSMAAALQTPVIEAGKQNAVKAGVATVDGAQGFGIAVARRINDSVQVNLDVATDFETDTAARAGVNYSF